MTQDLSFAKGYAEGRQAELLGLGPQAGCGQRASIMTPYQVGYESGRNDATGHGVVAALKLAVSVTHRSEPQGPWRRPAVRMIQLPLKAISSTD
jgi:hypothetical protein